MTVPTNIVLPLRRDFGTKEDIDKYLVDLIFELQQMYEQLASGINGDIKSSYYLQRQQWTPILKGATTAGTFTYSHQIGWVFRQGLIVDVWFDILWTNQAGAAGNLYVELPYKVAVSDQKPFVGVLQTATKSLS